MVQQLCSEKFERNMCCPQEVARTWRKGNEGTSSVPKNGQLYALFFSLENIYVVYVLVRPLIIKKKKEEKGGTCYAKYMQRAICLTGL